MNSELAIGRQRNIVIKGLAGSHSEEGGTALERSVPTRVGGNTDACTLKEFSGWGRRDLVWRELRITLDYFWCKLGT